MRKFILVLSAAATFALTACGGADGEGRTATDKLTTAPAAVIAAHPDDYNSKLACNTVEGFKPVEIGIGAHTEPNATYRLDEITVKDPYTEEKQQTGVKLSITAPGATISSGIIRAADSDDTELAIAMSPTGTYSAELKTINYARSPVYPERNPINSIVLCFKQ